MAQIAQDDLLVVAAQIKRQPRAIRSIAYRCPNNFPVVAVSEPVFQNGKEDVYEFFPTTYWLTCPQLRRRIADLESGGLIERLEKIFFLNLELKEMLEDAHTSYIHQRIELIGREKFFQIKNAGYPWLKRVLQTGIGGIENFRHLKCLHAHVAHHLAMHNNPVGQMTWELIRQPFCNLEKSYCQPLLAGKNLSAL